MRTILTFLVATAVMVGCRKQQSTARTDAPPVRDIADLRTGVVTTAHADRGCPLLVEMADADGPKLLIPIGLDEQYAKHGLKLKFTFTPSRAPQGACMDGHPAVLNEVTIVQ